MNKKETLINLLNKASQTHSESERAACLNKAIKLINSTDVSPTKLLSSQNKISTRELQKNIFKTQLSQQNLSLSERKILVNVLTILIIIFSYYMI